MGCWIKNSNPQDIDLEKIDCLESLLRSAECEGVAGIVSGQLIKCLSDPPKNIVDRVLGGFRAGAANLAHLERLGFLLRQEEIEVIALKGPALASSVYRGQLSLRPYGDLDLIVQPADESRVRKLAKANEFPVSLDLRHTLADNERIHSHAELCRVSNEEVWSRSSAWMDGVRRLDPELHLCYLAIHATKHTFSRLIWLVDVALVWAECHAESTILLAKRIGALRPVLLSVWAAHDLFELKSPTELPSLDIHERICLSLIRKRWIDRPWGEIFLALSVKGLFAKLTYMRELLFPNDLGNSPRRYVSRLIRLLREPDASRGNYRND